MKTQLHRVVLYAGVAEVVMESRERHLGKLSNGGGWVLDKLEAKNRNLPSGPGGGPFAQNSNIGSPQGVLDFVVLIWWMV